MDQNAVLVALTEGPRREHALAALAVGPRVIDCPGLGSGRLVVPRYREVRRLLRDPGFLCAPTAAGMLAEINPSLRPALEPVKSWVLYSDAPQHPRMRGLLAKAFTPRRVAALESRLEAEAAALVSRFVTAGGGDAARDIAEPLPVSTICMLLGVPPGDRDLLTRWVNDVILLTEPALTADQELRLTGAWTELWAYFSEHVEHRRAERADDIVSALTEAEEHGERLTREEVVANLITLLVGGHETTTGLIGGILRALAEHPHLAAPVADSTEAAGAFVEEVLRLDGPAQITARTAATDCEIGTAPVAAGTRLILLQASANRDPEVFEEPEAFRLNRTPNRHIGFGHGPHACFGAALARLEAAAVLRAVTSHDIRLRATGSTQWKPSQVIRAATALPLAVEGRTAP
ncbi:cytochrome P450 [Kitasatospora sp. NPDC059795]|uniref:cytochrome P450 n=1 Tax=Kitasatospora sp. NPDC059795 TaxID=3346949 RepID=UPI00364D7A33